MKIIKKERNGIRSTQNKAPKRRNINEKRAYLGGVSRGIEYTRSSLEVNKLNQKTPVAVPLFLFRRDLGEAI